MTVQHLVWIWSSFYDLSCPKRWAGLYVTEFWYPCSIRNRALCVPFRFIVVRRRYFRLWFCLWESAVAIWRSDAMWRCRQLFTVQCDSPYRQNTDSTYKKWTTLFQVKTTRNTELYRVKYRSWEVLHQSTGHFTIRLSQDILKCLCWEQPSITPEGGTAYLL